MYSSSVYKLELKKRAPAMSSVNADRAFLLLPNSTRQKRSAVWARNAIMTYYETPSSISEDCR
jgi:hypothetical protein